MTLASSRIQISLPFPTHTHTHTHSTFMNGYVYTQYILYLSLGFKISFMLVTDSSANWSCTVLVCQKPWDSYWHSSTKQDCKQLRILHIYADDFTQIGMICISKNNSTSNMIWRTTKFNSKYNPTSICIY